MYVEIVTPEEVLLSGEAKSLSVPGVMGAFQMLDNHAPIVSLLEEGDIKIDGGIEIGEGSKERFKEQDNKLVFHIKGGVVEMKDNKAIVLVD